jgi:protein SCO1/2
MASEGTIKALAASPAMTTAAFASTTAHSQAGSAPDDATELNGYRAPSVSSATRTDTQSIRRGLLIAGFAAIVLVTAAIAFVAFQSLADRNTTSTASIGGPFELVAQDGSKLSSADLSGVPFAVFFGFTHCPEVCPTTLWEMSEALKALGPDAEKLRVLFISIDPTRDTPEFLAQYLQSFDPRIVGLTGTEAQIAAIGKSYRAYWRKIPTDDGDYTMDHTASVYLMDTAGQFVGTIAYGEQSETRIGKLRKLMAGGTS